MKFRFRQLNLVADLICWSGTFSGFLLCIAQSKEQLLSSIARGFNIPIMTDRLRRINRLRPLHLLSSVEGNQLG